MQQGQYGARRSNKLPQAFDVKNIIIEQLAKLLKITRAKKKTALHTKDISWKYIKKGLNIMFHNYLMLIRFDSLNMLFLRANFGVPGSIPGLVLRRVARTHHVRRAGPVRMRGGVSC